MQSKFDFYADPGHGWLKVPIKVLEELGIAGSISRFSYYRNDHAYLEEDSDASRFVTAWEQHNHRKFPNVRYHRADKSSKIRNYEGYVAEYYQKLTIADVKRLNKEAGRYFFSKDTMRFFNSKVESGLYHNRYFITSEKPPHGSRGYSIRRFNPDTYNITTIGEVGKYPSKDEARETIREIVRVNG